MVGSKDKRLVEQGEIKIKKNKKHKYYMRLWQIWCL
jgi:hypothetical protein